MNYVALFSIRTLVVISVGFFVLGLISSGVKGRKESQISRQWESSIIDYQTNPTDYLSMMAKSGRWDIDLAVKEVEKHGFDRFLDDYEITAILLAEEKLVLFRTTSIKAGEVEKVIRLRVGDVLPDYNAKLVSIVATRALFLIGDKTVSVELYPTEF